MSDALGFKMYGLDFQWKIMNGVEPSVKSFKAYLEILKEKKVKLLFYNYQVTGNMVTQILQYAKKYSIPVMGVSETMPVKYENLVNKKTNSRIIGGVNKWFFDELILIQKLAI